MKILKIALFIASLSLGVTALAPSQATFADSPASQIKGGLHDIGADNAQTAQSVIPKIVNLLLFFVGAVSVIMIIYGGFKYVTSSGESSAVSSAKNTILYAVIGLVIALVAYGIANFVLTAVNGKPASNAGSNSVNSTKDAAQDAVDNAKK